MDEALFYRCERCGNIVALIRKGGGVLSCCGAAMTPLKANSTDAAHEKHVPVVKKDGDRVTVTVGSVAHPMEEKHYIEWIALVSGETISVVKLKPGMKPQAEFTCAGEKATAYAYCNLHGLWKADI
ncbi:MAG TPA: desulfoferrodoxin [Ruminococcaceae bacterium]|jgi:superoxide reductase|nr:desulfoferrodoxin [Oscillospiraceae bacterium]